MLIDPAMLLMLRFQEGECVEGRRQKSVGDQRVEEPNPARTRRAGGKCAARATLCGSTRDFFTPVPLTRLQKIGWPWITGSTGGMK